MSPVIAAHLSPSLVERLRRHPLRPRVVDLAAAGVSPWDVPEEAEMLVTFARGWAAAPRDRAPSGWPFRLRSIQVTAAGVDAFPPWFFTGPPVGCGRGVQADAIAEYVVAAVLLREKGFDRPPPRRPEEWIERPAGGIAGRTVGLLGYGAVGRAIAGRILALGGRVVAVRASGAPAEDPRVTVLRDAVEVAEIADHLVVALPLTAASRGVVGAELLARAKPGLHLVNVSRGGHVDHAALLAALDGGRVGAATLDVTDPEPLPAGHPFWSHPAVRLTPHSCGQSGDLDDRIAARLAEAVDRHVTGLPPLDPVDPGRGW